MDSDCYKVEVLHFLNPHLIWVEVSNPQNGEEFLFEQIGIYGLLPAELTLDLSDPDIKTVVRRCEDWAYAVRGAMKKLLSNAKTVFFQPTFIDRRHSIFDDNIHKYGEVLIMTYENKLLPLSSMLVKSHFAMLDNSAFLNELSLGKFKTKLNYEQTEKVVRHLQIGNKAKIKNREKTVKAQASVFQEVVNYETLTAKNLAKHNRQISGVALYDLMEKRMQELEECKDVDEVPLGRAFTRRKLKEKEEEPKMPSMLQKKLELAKKQKVHFLDHAEKCSEALNTAKPDLNNIVAPERGDSEHKFIQDIGSGRTPESERFYQEKVPLKKGKRSPKHKIPEYNVVTENRVAYGPPGINKSSLQMKIVPKQEEEEEENVVSDTDNRKEVTPPVAEPFDNVDSHVQYPILNRNTLKELNAQQIKQDDEASPVKDSDNSQANRFTVLMKKLALHNERNARKSSSSCTSYSDTTIKDSSTSAEKISPSKDCNKPKNLTQDDFDSDDTNVVEKINSEYGVSRAKIKKEVREVKTVAYSKNNINPFKNIDESISVFVDKLVAPVLMVHTKRGNRIEPILNIRDVCFTTHIHVVLRNMSIERPMMLQMVSWPVILRGFSLFMISPMGSGKTLGYLPAVCRLITDYTSESNCVGPICIIVCATAQSVSEVEHKARMFLGLHERVLSCYAGMDELHITTSLLNGCDLFICTPCVLTRLLQLTDFGIDLRRLATFVIEDGERLGQVYLNEVKYFMIKIKEMYKNRANKEHEVQVIVASRIWCDFMESLARKAPNSVICIGAFQECVLYSKTHTSVDFLKKTNKANGVLEFMKTIDTTKRTVIVCRADDDVDALYKVLTENKYIVFVCNSTMTVEDLYNLSKLWAEYQEPLLGPVLICCDGNLTHLNVTNAHYLVHYSLPPLYSMFCKRFSVLNDNYSSIFNKTREDVKIKVFLEDDNVEQLPKILNFIKRCTTKVPEFLGNVCNKILEEKDFIKGKNLLPVCDSLLALGECPDRWACVERHIVFDEYDQPKEWMPRTGVVTFKILHYHSAVHYSARLLSSSTVNNNRKYPQAYSTLSLKMGMYYSKEGNQKLHGIPKIGDICAVSLKQNFYARCQVVKILTYYDNGTPNSVLIKLIDEERFERTKDIYLFHLPDELKNIETHVVQVRLAGIRPKDNDVTFSQLAKNQLKKITDSDEDLFMRGQVVMTIGQCVFVETLDACQILTTFNETVVMHNFKKELLETHAMPNDDHVGKLKALCNFGDDKEVLDEPIKVIKEKTRVVPQWAHLENDLCLVLLSYVESPGTFFVRLRKFGSCMRLLLKDIHKHIETESVPAVDVKVGDIVLAKFPDDEHYERARVDVIIGDNKVKCFAVDQGDSWDVSIKDLYQIPDKFVTLVPFQAIECKLAAVKPVGDEWTEFAINWFCDKCFDDSEGNIKQLYVKYYSKENASFTSGNKYSVALIDTSTGQDELINELLIDLNLAQESDENVDFQDILRKQNVNENVDKHEDETLAKKNDDEETYNIDSKALLPVKNNINEPTLVNTIFSKPIRSVPLVDPDDEFTNRDWDTWKMAEMINGLFPGLLQKTKVEVKEESDNDSEKPLESKEETVKDPITTSNENDTNSAQIFFKADNITTSAEDSAPKNFKAETTTSSAEDLQKLLTSEKAKSLSTTLDSDDLSSPETEESFQKVKVNIEEFRKPKLVWRQNRSTVSVKIQLIGVEEYDLKIEERSLSFFANVNDTDYGFNFDLYGVVDSKTSTHSNKGQYILLKLNKVMKKNWLSLTKDSCIKKWIVYDVDSIDTSSDEEEPPINPFTEAVKNIHNNDDSDSDDDFLDDVNYEYKRDYD